MRFIDDVCRILEDAGEPLHFRDITERLISRGLWQTNSTGPERILEGILAGYIRENPRKARIYRFDWGVYGLRPPIQTLQQMADEQARHLKPAEPEEEIEIPADVTPHVKAAIRVLRDLNSNKPLKVTEIVGRAIERNYLKVPKNSRPENVEQIMRDDLRIETISHIRLLPIRGNKHPVRLAALGRDRYALIATRVPTRSPRRRRNIPSPKRKRLLHASQPGRGASGPKIRKISDFGACADAAATILRDHGMSKPFLHCDACNRVVG